MKKEFLLAPVAWCALLAGLLVTWAVLDSETLIRNFDQGGYSPFEIATLPFFAAIVPLVCWKCPFEGSSRRRTILCLMVSVVAVMAIVKETDLHLVALHKLYPDFVSEGGSLVPGLFKPNGTPLSGTPFKMRVLTNGGVPFGMKLWILGYFGAFFGIFAAGFAYLFKNWVVGVFTFIPSAWAVGCFGAAGVMVQISDRLPAWLGHSFSKTSSAQALCTALEEGGEMMIAIFALLAIYLGWRERMTKKAYMAKHKTYQKEFFDRDYSAREAYARLWGYARKYRLRLVMGVVFGMLTAGTLVPMFGLIQPALQRAEAQQSAQSVPEQTVEVNAEGQCSESTAVDKKAKGMLKEYSKVRAFAEKVGIEMQDDDDALGLPLLFAIIVLLPVVALLRMGLIFLNHYCLAWAGMKTVRDIRCHLLSRVLAQSMQFHGRIDVGQLMSRATSDPQQVQMIIQTVLQEIAQAPFEIAVSVGFIIWTAIQNDMLPTLGLLAFAFPLFMLPVIFLSKVIRKWSRRALERFSTVGSRIHEILTCIRAVKAYNTEAFEERRYKAANDDTLKATLRALRWGLLVGPAVETVGIVMLCAFLVWCFAKGVKLSMIVPMVAPLLIVYKPIKQLSKLQVQVEQGRAALARLWSLVDVSVELPEKPDAAPKATFDGKIVFDDVTFRYETAEHDAVSHASFEIPRGQMVAVVGGTGSGKTTMSGLLSRFFDPQSGRVTMDGTDLRDLAVADLRKLVGAVQQETLLFNDTIEENIKYGSPEATHEEVVAAAKMANAHDFIMSQPEGYARLCGEKGFALSGGERQRIAIARAILRNPPILILDEATSALDTVTERLVQDALTNLMKNRTVFAIAHRLSTIRNADLILVMDHGVIVERGTHDELYAKGGIYRKLCDMQNTN